MKPVGNATPTQFQTTDLNYVCHLTNSVIVGVGQDRDDTTEEVGQEELESLILSPKHRENPHFPYENQQDFDKTLDLIGRFVRAEAARNGS